MLVQSVEILESALSDIASKKPQFVLISGDLTKDGEISSHELLQKRLYALKAQGIQTYVVPGNHDVNNSHARSFHGATTKQVKSAQREDFAKNLCGFWLQSSDKKRSRFSKLYYRASGGLMDFWA